MFICMSNEIFTKISVRAATHHSFHKHKKTAPRSMGSVAL
jgi:hypothetical protein